MRWKRPKAICCDLENAMRQLDKLLAEYLTRVDPAVRLIDAGGTRWRLSVELERVTGELTRYLPYLSRFIEGLYELYKRKVRRCASLKMQMAVDVTTDMFGQCSANQKGSSSYLTK